MQYDVLIGYHFLVIKKKKIYTSEHGTLSAISTTTMRRSCSERVCGQQYLPWEKIEFSVSFQYLYTKGVVTKSKPIA